MKKIVLTALIGLSLLVSGYLMANPSQCPQHCTGGADCPCNPCPFK